MVELHCLWSLGGRSFWQQLSGKVTRLRQQSPLIWTSRAIVRIFFNQHPHLQMVLHGHQQGGVQQRRLSTCSRPAVLWACPSLHGSTIWQSRKNDLVWGVYIKDFLKPCPSPSHSIWKCVSVCLHMFSISVSMSTSCRKCVEVGVTPHTSHLKLDQLFFFRVISLQSRCVRVSSCLLVINYLNTTLYLKVP